jgi:hypothetical protein
MWALEPHYLSECKSSPENVKQVIIESGGLYEKYQEAITSHLKFWDSSKFERSLGWKVKALNDIWEKYQSGEPVILYGEHELDCHLL